MVNVGGNRPAFWDGCFTDRKSRFNIVRENQTRFGSFYVKKKKRQGAAGSESGHRDNQIFLVFVLRCRRSTPDPLS